MDIDHLKEQKSKRFVKALAQNFKFKLAKFGYCKRTCRSFIGFKNEVGWIYDVEGSKLVGCSWNEALGKLMSSKSFFVPMLDVACDAPTPIAVVSLYDRQYPLVEVKNEFFGMDGAKLCMMLNLLGFDVNAGL